MSKSNLNIISKLKFQLQKPKIVIVLEKEKTKSAILKVLGKYFKLEKDIFVFKADFPELDDFNFFIRNSSLPVLVLDGIKEGSFEKIKELSKIFLSKGFLVFNCDQESNKDLKFDSPRCLTYGLQVKADFQASEIRQSGPEDKVPGINFKVIHKGNIVPVWLENTSDQERIYSALAAITIGEIFGLNLIEASQAL